MQSSLIEIPNGFESGILRFINTVSDWLSVSHRLSSQMLYFVKSWFLWKVNLPVVCYKALELEFLEYFESGNYFEPRNTKACWVKLLKRNILKNTILQAEIWYLHLFENNNICKD